MADLGGLKWAALIVRDVAVAVSPAAVPALAPGQISVLGYGVPVLPALLGLTGLWAARMVASAKETRAGWRANLGTTAGLTVLLLAMIIERHLGPGVAVVLGLGMGTAGYGVLEVCAQAWERMRGRSNGNGGAT